MEETAVAAAGSAADDSEEDSAPELASQELSPEKKKVYSIVNEFLGNITFSNPEAEGLLQAALLAEACLPASMQMRLQDVFSPIFYYFPKGVKDRSVWEPRDTSRYIAAWYRLGSMRNRFGLATVDSRQLNYEQVTQIFNIYMAEMMHNLLPHQHNKTQAYYRSCASAKLKDEAGSKNLAKVYLGDKTSSIAMGLSSPTTQATIRRRTASHTMGH